MTASVPSLTRRAVLGAGIGLLSAPVHTLAERAERSLWIPGYAAREALFDGAPAAEHPVIGRAVPQGYDGPVTLLTKVALATARVQHAAYPVQGHVVAIDPVRGLGVLHSQSRDWSIAFDAGTMDMIAASSPFKDNRVGGGHAAFIRDGAVLLTAERAPYGPYLGAPQSHHGTVAIREPDNLREIGQISSHGVGPHDIQLLEDGKTLAIANYGTVAPHDCEGNDTRVIEPSISFVELDSGKLLDRIVMDGPTFQIRHFAIAERTRLMAIQVREGPPSALATVLAGTPTAQEPDRTATRGCAYLPAPMLSIGLRERGAPPELVEAENPALMRQGLSIVYEPGNDQFIASFPSAHRLIICAGQSGRIARTIDTREFGLEYPCGIALHPDGGHYLVAGSFGPIRALTTGTHRHLPDFDLEIPLYRHSHIKIS